MNLKAKLLFSFSSLFCICAVPAFCNAQGGPPGGGPGGGGGSGGGGTSNINQILEVSGSGKIITTLKWEFEQDYPTYGNVSPYIYVLKGGTEVFRYILPAQYCTQGEHTLTNIDLGEDGFFANGQYGNVVIMHDGYQPDADGFFDVFFADPDTGQMEIDVSGIHNALVNEIAWSWNQFYGCHGCGNYVPKLAPIGENYLGLQSEMTIYGGGGGLSGCGSCGGGVTDNGEFSLIMKSRFDLASLPSLIGPGFFFDAIDSSGRVFKPQNGSYNGKTVSVRLHNMPYICDAITMGKSQDPVGVMDDPYDHVEKATLLSGTTPTDNVGAASHVEVTYFNGFKLLYETTLTPDGSPDVEKDLRLVEIINIDGTKILITYIGSAGRKINTVTDAKGNVFTFTCGAEVAGRSTVTSVAMPNGSTCSFGYTGDFLTSVSTQDWTWSATVTPEPATQTTCYEITHPENGTLRYKLTQDFMVLDTGIINQPASVCRSVETSSNRNIISVYQNPNNASESLILRGDDQLSKSYYQQSEQFATSFTIGNIQDGYNAFTNIQYESFYEYRSGATTVGVDGYSYDSTVDSDGYETRRDYSDGTFTESTLNAFKQETRSRDRAGRVTKYIYDSAGRVLERQVGILDVSGTDVNQPEYAVYEYEYYPSGHVNEGMLKTEFSPLNTGQTDIYRTDYEYDANDRLLKKIESADVAGGTRPEWVYTYNGNGQLATSADPLGRTATYTYDSSNRVIQTLYNDGSTEQVYFDPGVAKYEKDRNGIVSRTRYTVDGKIWDVTQNYGQDTNILDGVVGTIESDANKQSVTVYAYDLDNGESTYTLNNGNRTEYTNDYRRRTTKVRSYFAAGQCRDSDTAYDSRHRVFYTEDHWGRRSYNGFRTSDGDLVRTIQCAHDGITYANNAAVMAATRVDGLNDTSIIADAILNDAGEVTDIYDARGIQTTVVFNSRGQVTTRTEAVGETVERKTETDYDVAGNATEVRHPRYFDSGDSNGYQKCKTVSTYNGRGLLASTVAASGSPVAATTSYTYHLDGKQATRTDPRGKVWSTDYHNCCGRFLGSENPLGHGKLSNTDYSGRVTHAITVDDYDDHTSNSHNPVDAKTMGERTVRYDGLGRTIASTQWLVARGTVDENDPPIAGFDSVSASDGLTSQVFYDSNLADGVGLDNTTGVTVDKMGGGTFNVSLSDCLTQLAESFANGGANLSFSNNYATGSAAVSISPEYNITVTIRDGSGQTVMTATIESFNGSNPNDLITWSCRRANFSEVSESGFGNVVTSYTIDALGNTSISRADGAGRVLSTTDAESNVSTVKYDANGQVKESRDPNGVGFDAVYDELGQLVLRADTYGDGISYGYDENGNQLSVTDAKSEVTSHLYDALNRRVKTTDRLGGETEYAFDLNGNMTSITDAEDKVTEYEFDDAGQKTKERYPDHVNGTNAGDQHYGVIEFAFDPAGRLRRRTDQKGDTSTLNYDLVGRLTSKDYRLRVDSPSGMITDTDSFTYDSASRMLTAVSGRYANTVTKTYDDVGRLEDESLAIGAGMSEKTYTVSREYDDRSRLWKLTYPDSTVVERTYTDRGQLQTVKYGATTIDTRAYDVGGRLTTSTYGNGVVTTYGYRNDSGDKDNQIDSIDIVKSSTSIDAFDYAYDANKNIVSESRTGTMSNYGWDTDDSGVSGFDDDDRLTHWERDDNNLTQEWNLSLVGDWNSITENTVATTHSHNNVHELTDIGSNSLLYDANGNMTTNHNGDDYSWDFDNRMSGADTDATAGNDVTFEYDALGRRVRKDNGTDDVVFVHSGQQVIAEYDFGTVPVSPTEQYVYGSYIDEPIIKDGTLSSGSGIVYYHHDRRYSVVALTNTSGSAVERYAYSPYGEMSVFSGGGASINGAAYANTVTYTGRQWDEETELYYFRARYFAPTIGIFIGRDPLEYVDGLSLYRGYFGIKNLDPSGTWIKSSGSTWEAEEGDTFEQLIQLVNHYHGLDLTNSNISCLIPRPDLSPKAVVKKMEKKWRTKKPVPCGVYDTGNIDESFPVGNEIRASIGADINGYIGGATFFYGATNMTVAKFLETAKENSKEGKSPIRKLILIGHGHKSKSIGGDGRGNARTFERLELIGNAFQWRRWKDAVKGSLPIGCWFHVRGGVRFTGCNTSALARNASNSLFRGRSIVYGTNNFTFAGSGWMGWGTIRNGVIVLDNNLSVTTSEDEYHFGNGEKRKDQHVNHWVEYEGNK